MSETNASRRRRIVRPSIVVGATLILIFGAFWALAAVRALLLIAFLGLLLSAILRYPIAWLNRRLPLAIAVVLTILLVAGVIAGLGLLIVPKVYEQLKQLWNELPGALEGLDRWLAQAPVTTSGPQAKKVTESVRDRVTHEIAALVPKAVPLAMDVVTGVSGAVLVIVLALFVAAEPDTYAAGFLRLVPPDREPVARESLRRLHEAVRNWMVGILAAMLLMGAFTAVGLWIAGVHAWLALGLLTFFGTFVPYLGAIASAIPGLLVALADSPIRFLWALVVYLGVHLLEGYVVQPLIMKKAVSLRPGVLIVWQLLMGGIFGVMGVVVATPLLACAKVAVQYLWVERTLGKAA